MVAVVRKQALETVSYMARSTGRSKGAGGARKLGLLLDGESIVVDVVSGFGIEQVRKQILSAVAGGTYVGGKVPRKFLEFNRLFLEYRSSPSAPPNRALLGRELAQMAGKCGLKEGKERELALDFLVCWQNTRAIDLKTLGIPDKMYVKISEIARATRDFLSHDRSRLVRSLYLRSLPLELLPPLGIPAENAQEAGQGVSESCFDDVNKLLLRGQMSEDLLRSMWCLGTGGLGNDSKEEEINWQSMKFGETMSELSKRCLQLEASLQNATRDLQVATTHLKSTKGKIRFKESERVELQAEGAALGELVAMKQAQVLRAETSLPASEEDLQRASREHEQAIAKNQSEEAELEKQLKDIGWELGLKAGEVAVLHSEISELSDALDAHREQYEYEKERLEEAHLAQFERRRLNDVSTELDQQDVAALHAIEVQMERVSSILRAKQAELKIRQDEHDDIKLRFDTSSNALEALMTEVDREKAAFDDTIAEILGREAVLGDVTRDLQATKTNLEINASKLRAKEDDIAALQAEQTACDENLVTTQEHILTLETSLKNNEQDKQRAQREHADAVAKLRAEEAHLRQQLNEVHPRYRMLLQVCCRLCRL